MIKLFVGGISPDLQEIELVQLIAIYGEVATIKMVRDRKTGKGKGYCFVEMLDLQSAENAIENLDGRTFGTRELTLNIVENVVKPPPRMSYQKVTAKPPVGKQPRPRRPPSK